MGDSLCAVELKMKSELTELLGTETGDSGTVILTSRYQNWVLGKKDGTSKSPCVAYLESMLCTKVLKCSL